jgi:anti-sigma B factor antagonist
MIETYLGDDSTRICRPWGELDWTTAFSLRQAIHDLLEPGVGVVIDLSRVSRIDATGLSALVGSLRRVTALGGTARLCQANQQVRRRLEWVGLDGLLLRAQTRSCDVA